MASREYKYLNQDQIDHFMKHGYCVIPQAFSKEKAEEWTSNVWTRLGMSPTDKSTWTSERINMPHHRTEHCATFAPTAWGAMCELLGGEERVDPGSAEWRDGLIVNLGTPEYEGKEVDPKTLDGWHVDGDFFVHFLDSPEQGLLVIPIFTEIQAGAGGTMVCPEAIGKIAKHLHDHPEGVMPRMGPRGQNPPATGLEFYNNLIQGCSDFHEMTGNIGDVVLLHPLMVHSASRNQRRIPRIITNPPVSLREPFVFNRENKDEYSIVERKTLQELSKSSLPDWTIVGERERVVPERLKVQNAMKEKEIERLKALNATAPAVAAA